MPYSRLLVFEDRQQRLRKRLRLVRAVFRNARAVWHEFQVPIVVMAVAIFGGGWVYGELLVALGYARVPYIDLPYTMLALMILETPTDIPPEVPLVAFWYGMPFIGAFVAARGVSDFVRLFFNPDGNRNAWEEAVASTYRYHVIVLGAGHLGQRVVRELLDMGIDVVAIDLKAAGGNTESANFPDVPLVVGDGRQPSILDTAGIRRAQALIVCTSNDYMNLEVTMRARDMNPDIRIVVRMWGDQFVHQIENFLNVEAVLSATNLAAPSFAGYALGIEITQTLHVNGEDYSMIRLEVRRGSFLDGETIGRLQDVHNMDIVLHGHADDVQVHPPAHMEVVAGDTLVVFAKHSKITDVVARNQRIAVVS